MSEPFSTNPNQEGVVPEIYRSAESKRFIQARLESEKIIAELAKTGDAIKETWGRILQNRSDFQKGRALRRATLNLLEDANLARRREEKETIRRNRAEEAERASELRYRALFETIAQGFCIIEVLFSEQGDQAVDYRFLEVNPAFERHTGLSHVVGRCMRELAPQVEEYWFSLYGEVALTGQPARIEHRAESLGRDFEVYASRAGAPEERLVAVLFTDVTERRRNEEGLRKSEETLRLLVENLPGSAAFIVDRGLRYIFAGGDALSAAGLRPEDFVGRQVREVVDPANADRIEESYREAFRGQNFAREHQSHGRFYFTRGVPLRTQAGEIYAVLAVSYDITDRKAAEEALRASEERLRLVVESARDFAIFTVDEEGRVMSWNTGAHLIFGYTAEEILGQDGTVMCTPEDRASGRMVKEMKLAAAEGRAIDERWHLRKGGERFWGSGSLVPLRVATGATGAAFLMILSDQTEAQTAREALEESRERLWRALQETELARASAEAAGEAKDRFLAVLSHELRTPLTPVLVAVRILSRMPNLPPVIQKSLEMIQRNVLLESHFIDDLLDLTRIERGKLDLQLAPVDVHEIVLHAVEIARHELDGKGQKLSVALEATLFALEGDANRLQQVFWNIIKNASKFTPTGGEIGITSRNLRQEGESPMLLVVEVSDTGIGFDEEAGARIFEAFTQESREITQKFGGLGLGLAISKATIDAHGGRIEARSAGRNCGATFSVQLAVPELRGEVLVGP